MRYVSGIRPSGSIHLGNYIGAIRHWKSLQDAGHSCVFFIADLHGIHSPDDVSATKDTLIRLGIKDVVIQSQHAAAILPLAHRLSFHVPVGWLNRMTQFKDKSQTEAATLALFSYPVLMAADILYHEATHVPIGADQQQHLEFVRDLVDSLAAKGIHFTKPQAVISEYPRIMSLTDGTKKMSKSDPDDFSRINLTDSAQLIREKVSAAKTSMAITDATPEANNLRTIYRAVGGKTSHTRWREFKDELSALICHEIWIQGKR